MEIAVCQGLDDINAAARQHSQERVLSIVQAGALPGIADETIIKLILTIQMVI